MNKLGSCLSKAGKSLSTVDALTVNRERARLSKEGEHGTAADQKAVGVLIAKQERSDLDFEKQVTAAGGVHPEILEVLQDNVVARSNFIEVDRKKFNLDVRTLLATTKEFTKNFAKKVAGKATGSESILISNKDLVLSEITPDSVKEFLKDDSLDERQIANIELFSRVAGSWVDKIRGISKTDRENNYSKYSKNPVALLTDDNHELPNEVLVGIAFAAYTFVQENAGTNSSGEDLVRNLVGKTQANNRENEKLTPADWSEFGRLGESIHFARSAVGKKVLSAVGLQKKSNSDPAFVKKTEAALGTYGIELLKQLGLIREKAHASTNYNINWYPKSHVKETRGLPAVAVKEIRLSFVSFPRDEKVEERPLYSLLAQEIYETGKETGSVLNRLFATEGSKVMPRTEYDYVAQELAKNSTQEVSTLQEKQIESASKREHTLVNDVVTVLEKLPSEVFEKIGGVVDTTKMQATRRASAEAKNDAIKTEISDLREFISLLKNKDQGVNTPFYTIPAVWKQFRAGPKEAGHNIQGSLTARYASTMVDHETTVDTEAKKGKALDTLNNFKMGVAQGLGVDIDKQNMRASITEFDDLINTPEVSEAVKELQDILAGKSDKSSAIVKLTTAEEGYHSLNALTHLVKYIEAKDNPESSVFTSNASVEIDGVTNGPALGKLFLAATDVNGAESFGFYTSKSKFKNYPAWIGSKAEGHLDQYQQIAKSILDSLPSGEGLSERASYIIDMLGIRDMGKGRKLVKTPTTMIVFGAKMETVTREGLFADFLDSVYEMIETTVNDDPSLESEGMKTLVARLNVLFPDSMPEEVSADTLMEYEFPRAAVKALQKEFINTVSGPVEDALKSNFAALIDNRKSLNSASQSMFDVYKGVKAQARDEFVKELMDKGELPYTYTARRDPKSPSKPLDSKLTEEQKESRGILIKTPLRPLTAKEETELDARVAKYHPVIHTAFSKASDQISAGFRIGKTSKQLSSKTNLEEYQGEVKLTRGGSTTTRARVNSEADPGVSTVIGLLHSTDSYIASMVYGEFPAINVHDALFASAADAVKVGRALNRHTFKALINYSMPLEVARSHGKILAAAKEDGLTHVGTGDKRKSIDSLEAEYQELLEEAYTIELKKLRTIRKFTAVNQYGYPGGHYVPTATDKKAIDKKIELISTLVARRTEANKVENAPVVQETVEVQKPQVVETEWGTIPGELSPHNTGVWEILGSGQTHEANKVLSQLNKYTKQADPTSHYGYSQLMQVLAKSIPQDLKVVIVGKDTELPAVIKKGMEADDIKKAPAMYVGGAHNTIYVKGPEFSGSLVSMETVLHEMVHATTATALQKAGKDSELYKELEDIRKTLADFVDNSEELKKDKNLTATLKYATQNVDELLSVGLTHPKVQEVLSQIDMGKRADNKGVKSTLLKRFLSWVGSALLQARKGSSKSEVRIAQNGLAHLYANYSKLVSDTVRNAAPKEQLGLFNDVHSMRTADQIKELNTTEMFEALGEVDSARIQDKAHAKRVGKLLGDMIHPVVLSSNAVLRKLVDGVPSDATDVYVDALVNGDTVFASESVAHFSMSAQEAYALDSIEMAVDATLAMEPLAANNLRRLYEIAKRNTKGKLSDADHDFIFNKSNTVDDKSNHLSKFVALGVVHKPLADLLATTDARVQKDAQSTNVLAKMVDLVKAILTRLVLGATGGGNTTKVGERLEKLTKHLAASHNRKASYIENKIDQVTQITDTAIEELGAAAKKVVNKAVGVGKESKFPIVNFLRDTAELAGKEQLGHLYDAFVSLRNHNNKNTRLGATAELFNEMATITDDNESVYALLGASGKLEQRRRGTIENMRSVVSSWFDADNPPSDSEMAAITRVLLRGDLVSVSNAIGYDGLSEVMQSQKGLSTAIKKMEMDLKNLDPKLYAEFVSETRALGYHLATGKAGIHNQKLNAHNIAIRVDHKDTPTDKRVAEIKAIVDPLASLYALDYLNALPDSEVSFRADKNGSVMKNFRTVFAREMARGDENGIIQSLKYHQILKDDALNNNFGGNPIQVVKGYTKDTLNPHIDLDVIHQVDLQDYKDSGYTARDLIGQDASHVSHTGGNVLVTRYGGGLKPYVTGSVSNTGERSKGTKVNAGLSVTDRSQLNVGNFLELRDIAKKKLHAQHGSYLTSYNPAVFSQNGATLIPIYNDKGEVANYRYLMTEVHKDDYLERNNNVEQVLATMTSHALDKIESDVQNKKVVDMLLNQYKGEASKNSNAYVEFGPDSSDPQIREAYKLLPEKTKQYIRDTWGGSNMYVRNDHYNMVFGYRSYSMVDGIRKAMERDATAQGNSLNGETRRIADILMLNMLGAMGLLSEKSLHRIRQAEDQWQEVVKMLKDNIVIKNLFTLTGNIASNNTVLWFMGVSLKDILKSQVEGIQALNSFTHDTRELFALDKAIELGLTGRELVEAEQRIRELKDAIDRSPIKELIDAGMYQTIVEDIDTRDTEYSYVGKYTKEYAGYLDFLPPIAKEVGKQAYLTHDTAIYKFLNNSTQYSDFVARYALFKHMTSKDDSAASKKKAIHTAMELFVNYDVPTGRGLQYMNDMGLLMFTKYFLRIQKALALMWRDHPGRGLGLLVMSDYLSGMSTILESSMATRLGNPLDVGALNYPGSVDDIITLNIAKGMFD